MLSPSNASCVSFWRQYAHVHKLVANFNQKLKLYCSQCIAVPLCIIQLLQQPAERAS